LLSTYAARLSVPHAALSIHNGHLGSESGVMEIASWKINALNIRPWDLKVGPWNSRVAREIIGHWEMTVGLHIYIYIYVYIYIHTYISINATLASQLAMSRWNLHPLNFNQNLRHLTFI
jgi:hypothetical protein